MALEEWMLHKRTLRFIRQRGGKSRTTIALKDEPPNCLDHFHLFLRLPVELQLMIWAFARENRLVIRHAVFYGPTQRDHGARNAESGEFITASIIKNIAKEGPNDILDTSKPKTLFRSLTKKIKSWDKHIFQASTSVSFDKDIFSIFLPPVDTYLSSGYLFDSIHGGGEIPKWKENWWCYVQQLEVWWPAYVESVPAPSLIFSLFPSLKTVFLSCPPILTCRNRNSPAWKSRINKDNPLKS
ncbi:hypothetical protein F5Y13DRAFT_199707 [Hypoxylon sp. FL1857]|nr:hypothetical protein F5Y13DRAFT_199707 [Hypoxylon sp. FL1857]